MSKLLLTICLLFVVCTFDVQAKVSYEEANGANGYYTKSPTITIEYEEMGTIKYRIKNASGQEWSGQVNGENTMAVIEADKLIEGSNYLDIWIEDEEGKIVDSSIQQLKFCIDGTAPQYPLQFKDEEVLEIYAIDTGSGIAGIYCMIEGEETQFIEGNQAFITLPENFSGRICAYAIDRAGNEGAYCYFEKKKTTITNNIDQKTERLTRDLEKPEIQIEGVRDFQVIREAKKIIISVKDNEMLAEAKCVVCKKDLQGEYIYELSDWEMYGQERVIQYEISEEGIYRFYVEGKDEAGNSRILSRQIVYDANSPVLNLKKTIEGTRIDCFSWKVEEIISVEDLTTCFYELRMDGVLYKENQILTKPGKHRLQILVRDLAGNESREVFDFYIVNSRKGETLTWIHHLISWINKYR